MSFNFTTAPFNEQHLGWTSVHRLAYTFAIKSLPCKWRVDEVEVGKFGQGPL